MTLASNFPAVIGDARDVMPDRVVIKSDLSENAYVRYAQQLRQRERITLVYDTSMLTPAQMLLVDAHILSAAGASKEFDWFDWITDDDQFYVPIPEKDSSPGKGDGSTTAFTLPVVGGSGVTFFVNGASVTGSLSAGTGPDSRDVFTCDAAPGLDTFLTCSFTGQRVWRVRYVNDDQPLMRDLQTGYYRFTAELSVVKHWGG